MSFATRRAEFTQRGGGRGRGGGGGGGGVFINFILPISLFWLQLLIFFFTDTLVCRLFNCVFSLKGFRGRGGFGGGPSFDVRGGDWPCPNR